MLGWPSKALGTTPCRRYDICEGNLEEGKRWDVHCEPPVEAVGDGYTSGRLDDTVELVEIRIHEAAAMSTVAPLTAVRLDTSSGTLFEYPKRATSKFPPGRMVPKNTSAGAYTVCTSTPARRSCLATSSRLRARGGTPAVVAKSSRSRSPAHE
jgi:hypothetical protein